MSVVAEAIAEKLPIIVILKDHGFSIRNIATAVGIPKSTLARWMPCIEQLVSEVRLGLHQDLTPNVRELISPSRTGRSAIEPPQKPKLLTYQPVPDGTKDGEP